MHRYTPRLLGDRGIMLLVCPKMLHCSFKVTKNLILGKAVVFGVLVSVGNEGTDDIHDC